MMMNKPGHPLVGGGFNEGRIGVRQEREQAIERRQQQKAGPEKLGNDSCDALQLKALRSGYPGEAQCAEKWAILRLSNRMRYSCGAAQRASGGVG